MAKRKKIVKLKVLLFVGVWKFGNRSFGMDQKAATQARDKYFKLLPNGK